MKGTELGEFQTGDKRENSMEEGEGFSIEKYNALWKELQADGNHVVLEAIADLDDDQKKSLEDALNFGGQDWNFLGKFKGEKAQAARKALAEWKSSSSVPAADRKAIENINNKLMETLDSIYGGD